MIGLGSTIADRNGNAHACSFIGRAAVKEVGEGIRIAAADPRRNAIAF